jgi:hypothetical protein
VVYVESYLLQVVVWEDTCDATLVKSHLVASFVVSHSDIDMSLICIVIYTLVISPSSAGNVERDFHRVTHCDATLCNAVEWLKNEGPRNSNLSSLGKSSREPNALSCQVDCWRRGHSAPCTLEAVLTYLKISPIPLTRLQLVTFECQEALFPVCCGLHRGSAEVQQNPRLKCCYLAKMV